MPLLEDLMLFTAWIAAFRFVYKISITFGRLDIGSGAWSVETNGVGANQRNDARGILWLWKILYPASNELAIDVLYFQPNETFRVHQFQALPRITSLSGQCHQTTDCVFLQTVCNEPLPFRRRFCKGSQAL
jgi:hypothetical protein